MKVRQGDLSGGLVQLRELEREASTKRAVYESYLLRARETGEQRDINTANMSVISTAYPPLDPTGPSRSMTRTDLPRAAISRAQQMPIMPAPITVMS